ncbi:MAG TPA: HEPN domain-containing protein [Planctomycetota bacterium]|nr:HEPN domain-containing protein [Planctomycetota bacterium]
MNADENAIAVTREWVEKAEEHLLTAVHSFALGKRCPADMVCFHAQQCVETYLKALLSLRAIEFPKTHNIMVLLQLAPSGVAVSITMDERRRFNSYAVTTRYPGSYKPITLTEAREAVKTARRVRREVRRFLPKAALSQQRKR